MDHQYATVAELADALDLGSSLNEVGVQVSSVAPKKKKHSMSAFFLISLLFNAIVFQTRARSSVGRAFGSHPRGRGFDSLRVHHFIFRVSLWKILY